MLYLDTSALLKLFVYEPGSKAVQSSIMEQDYPLPIWEVQEMELINALRLKVFWKEITDEQAQTQIDLFNQRMERGLYFFPEIHRSELMSTYRRLSMETSRQCCRTLDILHVACAMQLAPNAFITFDKRQKALARYFGLHVPDLREK